MKIKGWVPVDERGPMFDQVPSYVTNRVTRMYRTRKGITCGIGVRLVRATLIIEEPKEARTRHESA